MNVAFERQYPTPLSNSTLLPLLLLSLSRQRHTPVPSTTVADEYDYIIVGGGAAGSVVAGRLSEVPCVNVLLLEAGHEPPLLTEVPGLAKYIRKSDVNWDFSTVPQKHGASGFVNNQMKWASGKMLGGSGSLNGMLYVRGNRRDYDNWAAMGAKGWSYEDVFPYFLKLEDNRALEYLDNGYHAVGGPITADFPSYFPRLKQAVHEGATELGYEFVDSNAAWQTGFYGLQANVRDDQRCSSVKGYLVPAENRTNLDILVNAVVTKIVIEDGQAVGVEFYYENQFRFIKCRKEVIMSAGTENTPKLLMLSGIGPKEELEKWNISVIADLPVGKNFQDDAGTIYVFTLNEQFKSFDEKISDPSNILQYIFHRTGPLASAGSLATAFLKCANRSSPVDYPDYQIYIQESLTITGNYLGLKPEVYKQVFAPYEGLALFSCSVQQLRPESRGTITLKSLNPFDPPLIDPNYLQNPTDIKDIVEGLKTCKNLLNTEPFLELGAKAMETVVPGCERYLGNDEGYFECYAKTLLFTFHHPVGTSKMGDPADPTTVVDPELRVKGLKGLRVIDASVMPVLTAGNTHIPTIMIAEKASDMIKDSVTCLSKGAFL